MTKSIIASPSQQVLVELHGDQASKTPFPCQSKVYIYDDLHSFVIGHGTVESAFLQMGQTTLVSQLSTASLSPAIVYKVGSHKVLFPGRRLRLRNGCNVYLQYCNELLEGVILGSTDIPSNGGRRKFSCDAFWYSIFAKRGDTSFITHEASPSAVSYRQEPAGINRTNSENMISGTKQIKDETDAKVIKECGRREIRSDKDSNRRVHKQSLRCSRVPLSQNDTIHDITKTRQCIEEDVARNVSSINVKSRGVQQMAKDNVFPHDKDTEFVGSGDDENGLIISMVDRPRKVASCSGFSC